MQILAILTALLALVGAVQQILGASLTEFFCSQTPRSPTIKPGITILKPLCGVESLSETALESFFLLDYPVYQLVFGVQSNSDPILKTLSRLRARYPECDTALMINDMAHGRNGKVSNLINMTPLAKHEVLVISDADVHVPPYYLDRIVAALEEPQTGLVTTLYTGLPGGAELPARLGSAQINQNFLPGALLARRLGRQDCMGATMAIRKSVLAEIGGFTALVNHLADDQVLGRLVRAAGYKISLARVVPATTVPETSLSALFGHELRWARTIRALVPMAYAASVLQITLLWALLTVLISGFSIWSLLLMLGIFAVRVVTAWRVEAALRLPRTGDVWLFLLRDFFSTIIYIASFTGNRVDWRGQSMMADSGRPGPG
ncbi:bacteriohopanetetrol glucosamine biosynthesis glycosyltransferase HpnI [Acidocella sp.]|uniref:bacteriohopanetetrol glucosamine biosynthesis glycosyltransferase HpnI n=1 Tax=Acidocella sp. TaxID=50710 RepID=UPI003CFDA17D